jgi:hypothetical protein
MKIKSIFIVGVVVAGLAGCERGGYDFVPEKLVGVWETSAEKYSDRIFELRTDKIIFGTGEDSFALHAVVNVQEVHEAGEDLYTVYYRGTDGDEYQFAFYHNLAQDTIQFKNQKRISWTRRSSSSEI